MNPEPSWTFALLPRSGKTAWRRGRDQAQNLLEHLQWDGDLGHLERDVAAVADDLRTDLDQPLLQARQRPVPDRSGRRQLRQVFRSSSLQTPIRGVIIVGDQVVGWSEILPNNFGRSVSIGAPSLDVGALSCRPDRGLLHDRRSPAPD